jgi:hypothetical protein
MPVVPGSLDSLLFLFAGAFTAPSFQTFRFLVVGFLTRIGEHTVCGMLQAARLERTWHHSRAHYFFSAARWSADELGLLLLDFLIATFVGKEEPIRVAVDDSLFHRTGKQVYGARYQYDGSAPSGTGAKIGYGNNWVVLTLIVRLPFTERAVSLPVLFRLWLPDPQAKAAKKGVRAPRKANPAYPSKSVLARRMLDILAARCPMRKLQLLGDSAYATQALAGLPARVSVTSRLKANAAIYAPRPPRTGKPGQPAKKGARLPSLKAIAEDRAARWQQVEVTRSGKHHTVLCHAFEGLWYEVWGQRPVRVVIVRHPRSTTGYDIALVSTDMAAGPSELIERYDERWSIEVCLQDAKQITGVGEARNRTQRAVERTVPFCLLCQTLTVTWYALCGRAEHDVAHRRHHAPWYRQKRNPSYQDMLSSLRRAVIAAQYPPVTPHTPNQRETTNPAQTLKIAAG